VVSGDLAFISGEFIDRLKNGQTVGSIVDSLNQFFSNRAEINPAYAVELILKGNRSLVAPE